MTSSASIESPCRPRPRSRVCDAAEVHLWLGSVERGPEDVAHYALLDDAERARAERFRLERDRIRFVNRRALVRRVLARYLRIEPAEIQIRSSGQGRPELEEDCGIYFNASHSHGLAAVAVTHGRPVGVDIERVRHIRDALDLAQGLFAEREVESLRSVSNTWRSTAFLTLWTRKESFVKAVGGGLSIPLDEFDILTMDDGVGRPHGPSGYLPYTFTGFRWPEGHVGAVTVAGTNVRPRVSLMVAA